MINSTTIVGIIASALTGVSLLPQLAKLLKEKKPGNISMGMMITLLLGLIFWVLYGCLLKDLIIIISNAFSMMINIITIIFSLYYKKNEA